MWRTLLIVLLLAGGIATGPVAAAQDTGAELPTDLAAMPLTPGLLPDDRYQFARGGYLDTDDARYLIEQRYAVDGDVAESALSGWRQGYTAGYVLLSDRAYRLSDPVVTVTTTIHELDNGDAATVLETLLAGAPPADAEERDPAVEGATTWRVVTSQDDTLRTVARAGRFVVEIETAHRRLTPDVGEHAQVVSATIERVELMDDEGDAGISQRMVLVEDDRLVPVAVPTESPLAHTWYRMLDDEMVLAAGEMEAPEPPPGVTDIAIARQTAEISSQNWVTVGVVTARFDSGDAAGEFAASGIIRDPLDIFPTSEEEAPVESAAEPDVAIEAISGETRVGGRYSGYRVTLAEGDLAAQLTIRAMGSTLIDRDAVDAWAARQRDCLASAECTAVPLADLLQARQAATPVAAGDVEGRYASPVAPWAVAYDVETWAAQDTFAEGGYDYLYLRAERMDATFETIVDHRGDPEQCVLDELERLREDEDRARIDVGSDVAGEQPGGLEAGHGWIVYTVEPLEESRSGEEYTIRIDCYTVVEGSTSLVVQVRAPRDAWAEAAPVGEQLRAGIEIDGVPAGRETGDRLAVAPSWRTQTMINRRPWVGLAA